LKPDATRFTAHVDTLLESGCHGVVVFGTTGEATSFAVDERKALLDALLASGIAPERLIVGTGCCALSDTVALTSHAVLSGCRTVLMLPPFYYKGPSDEGLFRSYAGVIERVGASALRIFLYHFPQLSGVPITRGLLERLSAAYPTVIAGIKDSSGNWDGTAALIATFPQLCVFPGSEVYLLQALKEGGVGCITATANVNAGAIRSLYDAWCRDSGRLEALQGQIDDVRQAVEQHSLIPALKHIVSLLRADSSWRRVRPPLVPLQAEPAERLAGALTRAGFRFPKSS
jgi:4-hydroxy-tetrahydrodipicolinate synthase